MNVCVRLSKVHFSCSARPALLCSFCTHATIRYMTQQCFLVCRVWISCIICACEGTFWKQTVGIYVECLPCAHAASLIVRYAKGNMANWCHLVGLLGTRGLSMVPRHIGVVKINTVTLFGRKRHWTIYYCVYFSLSLTLRGQAAFTWREAGLWRLWPAITSTSS